MTELDRFISKEEFESGIRSRLLLGSAAVHMECILRVEEIVTNKGNSQSHFEYGELGIMITGLYKISGGHTHLKYVPAAEADSYTNDQSLLFDDDSMMRSSIGTGLNRAYLSDGVGAPVSQSSEFLVKSRELEAEEPETGLSLTSV